MSGECSFFNFCLRGRDSLVSKWISQKRKIPETLKTDGANIYAISEYIHTVFYFDKLYGSDYSCNVLFNKIIAINELDKNHIVKFDEIIKIPFDFTPCEFTERSFDDMAKDVSYLGDAVTECLAVIELKYKSGFAANKDIYADYDKLRFYIEELNIGCKLYMGTIWEQEDDATSWERKNAAWAKGKVTELNASLSRQVGNPQFYVSEHK